MRLLEVGTNYYPLGQFVGFKGEQLSYAFRCQVIFANDFFEVDFPDEDCFISFVEYFAKHTNEDPDRYPQVLGLDSWIENGSGTIVT